MNENVLDKFSYHCKHALHFARGIAQREKRSHITVSHITEALRNEKGSVAAEILNYKKSAASEKRKKPLQAKAGADSKQKIPELSPYAIKAIEKAAAFAGANDHPYIGTEHLLFGILEASASEARKLFRENELQKMKSLLTLALKSASKLPELTDAINHFEGQEGLGENIDSVGDEGQNENIGARVGEKRLTLDYFGTNLNDRNIQKNIDPVIEREDEIWRLIQILSRRTKNNPLLIGDPGVGKTALVEGLAKRILSKNVPHHIRNKKIYSLDMGLLLAGSSFRGEFEQRLKHVIHEVKSNPDIILFIDEIHTAVGAGSATGSVDAANILKPALARGDLRCIGATTSEEYRKYLENDKAFERRFQKIYIEEPSPEKTESILLNIKSNYEEYHKVEITNDAIQTAVRLAGRYIHGKSFPDKAIDLIDEAAAQKKVRKSENAAEKALNRLEEEYARLTAQKTKSVLAEEFDAALECKQHEEEIKHKILQKKKAISKTQGKSRGSVRALDIEKIIATTLRIPMNEIQENERRRILGLEKTVKKHIIGQDEIVSRVVSHLRKNWAGIKDAMRPIGSFLFLGPSGVGKTELAKVLANEIFRDKNALIRIDMSEFSESFNISKLIGSPAGYVGYKEQNALTDRIRKKPYSLVLFDEIEKSHPAAQNLLLQILEDGQITDASGTSVDFKNTIIIMTSNVGAKEFNASANLGFQETAKNATIQPTENLREIEKSVLKKLKKRFRPELLNRIDQTLVFQPLAKNDLKKIVKIQLENIQRQLSENGISLTYEKDVVSLIAEASAEPEQGARAVRKTLSHMLEHPLATNLLAKKRVAGEKKHARVKKHKIIIQ